MRLRKTLGVLLGAVLLVAGAGACSSDKKSAPGELTGLFTLEPGKWDNGAATGSWFRMVQAGGTPDKGPYMPNGDSKADGGNITLLSPGTAGGLVVGSYQSEPKPAFSTAKGTKGDSLANSIIRPTKFFGVGFGVSTNPVDPQTQRAVVAPSVTNDNGKLTANLTAWAASWNNQEFNQGAPKAPKKEGPQVPGVEGAKRAWDYVAQRWFGQDKSSSGEGPAATGTYDPKTGRYTLQWTSYIEGGPFNGFTGVWHLEGVVKTAPQAPTDPSATPGAK